MNQLAIDSSCLILSVALSSENEVFYIESDTEMKHSDLVMDYIDSLIKQAGIKQNEIDCVLCMSGPGSFTGLRIGYSVAKGLALSLSIKFIAVPTLDCIAFKENDYTIAAIESKKDSYYNAFYNNGVRITEDCDETPNAIIKKIESLNIPKEKKIILKGPGSIKLYESLPEFYIKRITLNPQKKSYAKEIISLAINNKLYEKNNNEFLYNGPNYIRLPDAQAALPKPE